MDQSQLEQERAEFIASADRMIDRLELTERYDRAAHQKAYEDVMGYCWVSKRNHIRIGEPPLDVSSTCTEVCLEALERLCTLKVPQLIDVTMGLGVGFAEMGEVCGTVSGAVIAIGLDIVGRYPRETASQRYCIQLATQKFIRDVRREFGSVRCLDILGHDISGILIPGDEKYATYVAEHEQESLKNCLRIARFAIMYPLPREQEGMPYSG